MGIASLFFSGWIGSEVAIAFPRVFARFRAERSTPFVFPGRGQRGGRCSEVKEEERAQPGPGDMSGTFYPAVPVKKTVRVLNLKNQPLCL